MRRILLALLVGLICSAAFGEFSEDELDRLEDVEISGIREDTYKDDDRNRFEMLEINTFQNEDDTEGFRMYIVVELQDKQKNKYLTGFKADQPSDINSDYTGEDFWRFYMPHGDLERLKISAYAVFYGVMDENQFMLLAEEYDGVKSLDEFRGQTFLKFPGKVYLMHSYIYNDSESDNETYEKKLSALK